MNEFSGILPSVQAKGIVIQITGEGESARRALEMVREELRKTGTEADRSAGAYTRAGQSLEHSVPKMAAASAGLRALEGNFTNNIRAGERFLTMLPGMADVLQTAFPAVGAVVLGVALVKLGAEAFHAFENVVMLRGAIESLNAIDLTVNKKLKTLRDQAEESAEAIIEAREGKKAALQQRYKYRSDEGLDLSEVFEDEKYKGLQSNIKANYENLYKAVAPADIPDRLAKIRTEVKNLQGALSSVQSGEMGPFVQKVGGYGPGAIQDPEKYYKARLSLAKDLQALLEQSSTTRSASLNKLQVDIDKPEKKGGTEASGNSIAEARAQLLDETAKLEQAKRKAANQVQLAEWEAQHKMLLVSDQEFYAKKLELQTDEVDAEQTSLTTKQKSLQDLLEKQHADPKLKRRDGVSAEELKTQRELVQVQESLAAIETRRAQLGAENTAQVAAAGQAAELAHLRIAADLEKQRNDGIAAQIALLDRETDIEAKRAKLAGGSDADEAAIRAKGGVLADKLRIEDVSKKISEIEADYRRRIEDTTDAASKGDITKQAAGKQIEQLNKDQVRDLKALRDAYAELANALGGDYKNKLADLDESLTKLGRHDRTKDWQYQVAEGMNSMVDSIAQSAARGKASVADMAKSMLDDLANLALKMTEQRLIAPLFEQMFTGAMTNGGGFGGGGTAPGASGGGSAAGASKSSGIGGMLAQLGSAVGGFWRKPAASAASATGGALSDIAKAGAEAKAPNMPISIVDQSQRGMSVQPQQSFDGRAWVTNILMQDLDEGGQIAQAFGRTG